MPQKKSARLGGFKLADWAADWAAHTQRVARGARALITTLVVAKTSEIAYINKVGAKTFAVICSL